MRQKKEDRPPILYERYKRMKDDKMLPLSEASRKEIRSGGWRDAIGNWAIRLILLAMIGLSTIGVIALLHPQIRLLLQEILNF